MIIAFPQKRVNVLTLPLQACHLGMSSLTDRQAGRAIHEDEWDSCQTGGSEHRPLERRMREER